MMSQESAETFGLKVLGWLIGNEELLPVFQGATGAAEQDLRERAGEAEFLGSVLDFLMMDDAWVVEFCDQAGVSYDQPMIARQCLPGGGQVHWT